MYSVGMRNAFNLVKEFYNIDDDFDKSIEILDKYFSGYTKDYLTSTFYYSFISKFSNDLDKVKLATIWYERNKNKLSQASYNRLIDLGNIKINVVNKPIPENILKLKLYDNSQNTVTLATILSKYSGKNIILDHWATWCGPCINEFPFASAKSKELGDEFVFLYISSDQKADVPNMIKLINEYKLESYSFDEKDYRIYKDYFNINFLPRYIMINSKEKVIDIELIKPSNLNYVKFVRTLAENDK